MYETQKEKKGSCLGIKKKKQPNKKKCLHKI